MHQSVKLIAVMLAISVVGCLGQFNKSLMPDKEGMDPRRLYASVLRAYNFKKIKPGMQREEVEQLLGGGPGYYGREKGTFKVLMTTEGRAPNAETWSDDRNMFEIAFDENDSVINVHKRAGYSIDR